MDQTAVPISPPAIQPGKPYASRGDVTKVDPRLPFVPSATTRFLHPEVGVDLTPESLAVLIGDANAGDTQGLNKLCVEVLEKNWEIAQQCQLRASCLVDNEWQVTGPHAKEAEAMLKGISGDRATGLIDFTQFLESAAINCLLPGYALFEIAWRKGGEGIDGFYFLPPYYTNFRWLPAVNNKFEGYSYNEPLLIIEEGGYVKKSMPLEPREAFVLHVNSLRGGDLARAGMRPALWLHLFMIGGFKGWLRYVEKFGIPYLVGKIKLNDEKAWEEEAKKLKQWIERFGSDQATVTGNNTELTAHEVSGTGNDTFKALHHEFKEAIAKLIVGQTSTSSSESSNRSTAEIHNLVRRDIQVRDCRVMSSTLNGQVLKPWSAYNYGPDAPQPIFQFNTISYADVGTLASTLRDLKQAGLKAKKPDEVGRLVGIALEETDEAGPEGDGYQADQENVKEQER